MDVNADVEELITYLESKDLGIVKHFKNVAQEKLYTSKDLLGTLMDRYIQTRAEALLELLIGVNDTLAMYLFDRLNDHLKHGACSEVCTILFSIVKKQPSWLHKIVGTSLFATFLKFLKNDLDIVFIMHGILILCSLIPCVPAIIGPHHGDILEVFVRTAGFLVNKSSVIPEVCALHLNVGIYIFFHRLYTMYPNNFLTYMKSCFGGNRRNEPVFQEIIKPMLEFVKFHPDLITDTTKSETGLEKWKIYQPHDVLAECQKISLDQIDMVKEATYAVYDPQLEDLLVNNNDGSAISGLNSYFSHPDSINHIPILKKESKESEHELPETQLLKNMSLCNPSEICGLSTPPSVTPSNSIQDVSLHFGVKPSDSDSRDSIQTLNDNHHERLRRSTGETVYHNSCDSPIFKHTIKKTKSFGSGDTFSHKAIFRSLLSNSTYHSTPLETKSIHTSAPASPRKYNTQSKRPQSTEFFRYKRDLSKQLDLGLNSDNVSVQSAPNSPMIPPNTLHFSFDADVEGKVKSREELMEAKERIRSLNMLPCHHLNHDHHVKHGISCISDKDNSNSPPPSCHQISLFKSIREMFLELFPKANKGLDSFEQIESSLASTNNLKNRSPTNLLDDFIQYGSDIHSYHLSRVPLTSQLDTDWTHYGGTTPVDELKILQTQVQLFHIQLQYERYKCELHCLRNRRLFGGLQKSQKAHDEVDALKDQILLAEIKLREMKLTMEIKCNENVEIKKQTSAREQEYMSKICKLEEQNNKLEYKLKNCKLKKKEERSKVIFLQQELHKVKYQLFDATQQYAHVQPKLHQLDHYQDVTNALEKELLIQYDKQESMKIKVEQSEINSVRDVDLEHKLSAHRHELKVMQDEKEMLQVHAESMKLKLNELELSVGRKDSLIMEQKSSARKLRVKHKVEVEALESRFESCRKTCQSLQSYITSLFAKLEEPRVCQNTVAQIHIPAMQLNPLHKKCGERCRKVSYSGPGSPHMHRHEHSDRHSLHSSNDDDNPFRSKKQSNRNSLNDDVEITNNAEI